MLSFATNHAPHVHLVKPQLAREQKLAADSVKKKTPQASCEETEIVAFSESDAVPANHKKKRRDQFMAASKSGLDVPD